MKRPPKGGHVTERRYRRVRSLAPNAAAQWEDRPVRRLKLLGQRTLVVALGLVTVWLILVLFYDVADRRLPLVLALASTVRGRRLPDPAARDQARRAHPQPGPGPLLHADRRWPSRRSRKPGPDRCRRRVAPCLRPGRLDPGGSPRRRQFVEDGVRLRSEPPLSERPLQHALPVQPGRRTPVSSARSTTARASATTSASGASPSSAPRRPSTPRHSG